MTGETLGFTGALVYNPGVGCYLSPAVPDVTSRIASQLGRDQRACRLPSGRLDRAGVTRRRRSVAREKGIVEEGL